MQLIKFSPFKGLFYFMGKDKLKRFGDIKEWKNVFEVDRKSLLKEGSMQGKWNDIVFCNDNPIVLELGCGHGDYTLALAEREPNKNYIGIDIKGARLWKGAKYAKENMLSNVVFLRTEIELLDEIFVKDEIDEIWITFPDPQILYRRAKHRLTHHSFLLLYTKILRKEGFVHLKTDDFFLHGYTLGLLNGLGCNIEVANHDLYHRVSHKIDKEAMQIQTYYEKKYLAKGNKISYIKFTIDALRDV